MPAGVVLEDQAQALGQGLSQLALESRGIAIPSAQRKMKAAFGDLLAVSPSTLILSYGDDRETEATMWDCFAEVYEKEVQTQEKECEKGLGVEQRRQILADILVWAEITQSHYDQNTAQFVTDPHGQDGSFQRIGALLKAAKSKRGLQ